MALDWNGAKRIAEWNGAEVHRLFWNGALVWTGLLTVNVTCGFNGAGPVQTTGWLKVGTPVAPIGSTTPTVTELNGSQVDGGYYTTGAAVAFIFQLDGDHTLEEPFISVAPSGGNLLTKATADTTAGTFANGRTQWIWTGEVKPASWVNFANTTIEIKA